MLLLNAILWGLMDKEEEPVTLVATATEDGEVQVAEFDAEAEFQARIWNKFMREPRKLPGRTRSELSEPESLRTGSVSTQQMIFYREES